MPNQISKMIQMEAKVVYYASGRILVFGFSFKSKKLEIKLHATVVKSKASLHQVKSYALKTFG